MINLIRSIVVILLSSYLIGCSVAKPIPMGNDTYMISQTSAGGIFKAMGTLKAEVMTRANEFAESKNKVAIPLASKESPASPEHMPNFEYQFKLVDKNDPQASGRSLIPRADKVVEINGNFQHQTVNDSKPDIYTELLKLDDLRKRGLITDTEFELQKSKLLSDN